MTRSLYLTVSLFRHAYFRFCYSRGDEAPAIVPGYIAHQNIATIILRRKKNPHNLRWTTRPVMAFHSLFYATWHHRCMASFPLHPPARKTGINIYTCHTLWNAPWWGKKSDFVYFIPAKDGIPTRGSHLGSYASWETCQNATADGLEFAFPHLPPSDFLSSFCITEKK